MLIHNIIELKMIQKIIYFLQLTKTYDERGILCEWFIMA